MVEAPATDLASEGPADEDPFAASRQRLEEIVGWLEAKEAAGLEHGELEAQLQRVGRELLCCLFQDHLDLRSVREQRLEAVADGQGVARRALERDHERPLYSVFGEVRVSRLAYRERGQENLYVADGLLNLPSERASHGVRRLSAIEAAAGSFEHATSRVREQTGLSLGKRQAEELAVRAAADFERFYAERLSAVEEQQHNDDVLVLSADGKGIVMRTEALRKATAQAAQRASPKLKTRLSKGEKANRKRIAEVGAVYEITPAPRTPAEVLAPTEQKVAPAPKAKHKWLTASVVADAAAVVGDIFEEAQRRDPEHERTWVALVDGNNHQIAAIKAEARKRKLKVTIVIDLVHVLEYLWAAGWCYFKEGDPDAEAWVAEKALAILEGKAGIVAAAIRRKATMLGLSDEKRAGADRCADYLLAKRPYLDYPTALANGWPIATGVIEGACRFLVKDRLDITGARWGLQGAEAILQLRALLSNGDFNAYWDYHLAQERHRNHDLRYANGVIPRP
ncbi:MAG: ISKra4 family transposase [Acidimicrobiales bacterium]